MRLVVRHVSFPGQGQSFRKGLGLPASRAGDWGASPCGLSQGHLKAKCPSW